MKGENHGRPYYQKLSQPEPVQVIFFVWGRGELSEKFLKIGVLGLPRPSRPGTPPPEAWKVDLGKRSFVGTRG